MGTSQRPTGLYANGPARFFAGRAAKPTAADVNSLADWVNMATSPPRCVVRTSQSLCNSTSVPPAGIAVPFDVEVTDTEDMHSPTVNPSRLTIVTSGWWAFTGVIGIAAITGGTLVDLYMTINGSFASTTRLGGNAVAPTAAGNRMNVSIEALLMAGDYVEMNIAHNGTNSPLLTTDDGGPRITARWTGR